VTAPLFLVAPGSLAGAMAGTTVSIGGSEGHHAVSVHRLRIGEEVLVGDGAGVRVSAEVVGVERHTLLTRVIEVQVRPPADPRFVLVQALAKGDRDEQAIEAATELGVDAVVPWQASRSVVQWRADKVARGQARWESIVVAAAKQSRRFQVPQVRPLARTADVVRLLGDAALGIVLHEEAQAPLASVELPPTGEIVLVVGPEGGIAQTELDAFAAVGGVAVRLGPEVLRTSTAGPAALAVLNGMSRWR
jgi:16S rRNA (uracil1498-N3)-methyltransferase